MKPLTAYPSLTFFKTFSWAKLKWLLPTPFLSQIQTVKYPLFALFFIIVVDLITGIISYFVEKRKKQENNLIFSDYTDNIMSSGLRQTVIKSYQYAIAIIVIFVIEVFGFRSQINFNVPLINIDATLTQFFAWTFILIEVRSIDENLKKIAGKSIIGSVFSLLKGIKKVAKELSMKGNSEEEEVH